jgi:signal transduction histidine kinase
MSDSTTSARSFSQLLAAELDTLKRTAQKLFLPTGLIIFKEGDIGDGVYVVEEGCVEISAMVGGQERRVLAHLGPGEFFGEMAVIDKQPRSATATAEVDTLVSFVSGDEMLRVLEQSPRLLGSLMREFSRRMREFDRRYLQEVFQAERLALVGRFAQSIVHDFKNPLNMIGLAADLACAENATAEHRSEAKVLIRKQVDRLAGMIGEVLEYTRGSSRPVAVVPIDYRRFVQQVLDEIRPEAAQRSVNIECENPPPQALVLVDPARLPHVFHNLINNAIDFMPAGGKITLRFRVSAAEVITDIEDSGPGIAPEIAEHLFEPFATHGKAHGTGLGLSICKRIVEDHNGKIGVRSEPGCGAVFSFTLPRSDGSIGEV